ncbi:MAG: NUDIX hydrolase [Anaerolineales bacterium]|nr:NUDIX hydrolase [Anaerolineales bacterium]MCA9975517.1 NUDIX hydrolase [Anaerolineales bacterium]MCB8966346.1 NUDIX hydrolase [Ardenticatenaceae bacterium]
MYDDLQQFLAQYEAQLIEMTTWRNGTMPLRLAYYLGAELPPSAYISSVRAVLLHEGAVMVVRDLTNDYHVVPGGRREAGESFLDTLRREMLEETGWTLRNPRPLGFVHFHHLAPKPDGYAFPYPDFLQQVYVAEAHTFMPEARDVGGYEVETGFQPIHDALQLPLRPGQRLWLKAAVSA